MERYGIFIIVLFVCLITLDQLTDNFMHSIILTAGFYSDGAKYVNQPVAVKIIHDSASMDKELIIFEKLKAINNPKIENSGIPQVYYHGWFLNYDAIAMTLFEGSVNDRYEIERKAGRKFTDTTILSIFLQAVYGT